uniref:Putative peptidoglycan recognition protein le n=1 Tax=Nyssomyia neivai TaxID=330878 RepID=A0A1L8E305_9DIPT
MESENLQENCVKEEKIKKVDVGEARDAEGNHVAGGEKLKFTSKWVEDNDFDASSSSAIDESTIYTSSVSDDFSDVVQNFDSATSLDMVVGKHKIITLDNEKQMQVNQTEILQHIFKGDSSVQTFDKIQIENSSRVHIGNVTYVTGPIHIITDTGGNRPQEHTEKIEKKNPSFYIGNTQQRLPNREPRIVDRRSWLAQPPMEDPVYVTEPYPYVIIAHTATESGINQAEMVYLVRIIQSFHIESRGWDDIGYNFLIGGDGSAYEGRGWNKMGSHTYGYNMKGFCIAFVGTYMNKLPSQISLDVAKMMIEKGVREGFIAPDYKLVGHCQCIPTESPGRMLYEEIKKWPNYSETI